MPNRPAIPAILEIQVVGSSHGGVGWVGAPNVAGPRRLLYLMGRCIVTHMWKTSANRRDCETLIRGVCIAAVGALGCCSGHTTDVDARPDDTYHVPGSNEGEERPGGGTAASLPPGSCFSLPLPEYRISGYHFGEDVGSGRVHAGDDVSGTAGTAVYALYDGQVVTARRISTWGTLVELRHQTPTGDTFYSLYGHLRQNNLGVNEGASVTRGQRLGELGTRAENGGWSEHLHFGVFVGTYPSGGAVLAGHVSPAALLSYRDPIPYLSGFGACSTPACTPNATRCASGMLYTCNATGTGETSIPCPTTGMCASSTTCLAPSCTPNATRCVSGTLFTCNATGTGETSAACPTTGTCASSTMCSVPNCTPNATRCVSGTLFTCNATGTGEISLACPSGFCSNPSACAPQETCNGVDDNGNGVIDEGLSNCWRTLYRFQNGAGARCLSTSNTIPPPACAGYSYEREAFVVRAVSLPGTYEAVQCSRMTDHIVVDNAHPDRQALEGAGYNCAYGLGYLYVLGAGPLASQTPFPYRCPLYRFSYVAGTGAHLFTAGPDNVAGMTCESPARADVHANVGCFSPPPTCP